MFRLMTQKDEERLSERHNIIVIVIEIIIIIIINVLATERVLVEMQSM